MIHFCLTKKACARYVENLLPLIEEGSLLTILIEREKSAGFYVSFVTSISSDDTPTVGC